MPTIYIDNKPFEVKAGKNLLEACLSLGADLPYFCWHPALGSVGACRQCAVKLFKDEQDANGKLVMSCMESLRDGMRLSIMDTSAKAFRAQVIEWLMTNHPHDCPVCDEGGSCHLQDMTVMTGHDYRRYHYKKRTYINQYLGPFVHHEMNRCIQCYRCVRYYRDYAGGKDLNVFAAHDHVYFGREKPGVLESPFSGNLAEVCPTGVFTDKTLKEHYTRKWDLTMAPSICQQCSLGCNIIAGERYGKLRCVVNRFNSQVNGYFLCDRGRFGYEFVNSENRITQPIIRNRAVEAVSTEELTEHLGTLLTHHTLIGIGSPRASVESNFALMQLVGAANFYQGIGNDQAYIERRVVDSLQPGGVPTASLKDIEQADAILVVGEDIWNTAPVMALAVRQAVMKTAVDHALQQTALPAWHDAAVKELVQEQKGFLANLTLAASSLDELSAHQFHGAPDDMARLGFAIAHAIHFSCAPVPNLSEDMAARAVAIAAALQQANHPVVISGTGCWDESLIKAAFDVVTALRISGKDAKLAYVLPECNSMGLAMMRAPHFEQAVERVGQEKNVVAIILENDLYRNLPASVIDSFLDNCKSIIVLDALHSRTSERADVLIPAATFAEADGSIVNNAGLAQRFYQVFVPANAAIKESWKWLMKFKRVQAAAGNGREDHCNEMLEVLETALPQFTGISQVAPHHDFRIHGQAVPREPHRYSGRTAMLANLSVSEPKPLQDDDSPFVFTMEGFQGLPPSPLIPFFWAPGWNSVQSVNKYQREPGGPLRDGEPGVSLFKLDNATTPALFTDVPEAFVVRQQKWLLLPQYHVFGSGELSVYTSGVRELSPDPYIGLSQADAGRLGVVSGSTVSIELNDKSYALPAKVVDKLGNGMVLMPAGLPGMDAMSWGSYVVVKKE